MSYVTRLRYEVRRLLSPHPAIFLPLMRTRPDHKGSVLGPKTDIVIEGFARSGNTFAVAALTIAQTGPVSIASHLHAPSHVTRQWKSVCLF